jgi:hypothetical protein
MRKFKEPIIIAPQNKPVKTITIHIKFNFKAIEKMNNIKMFGNLCKVLANQKTKDGSL